MTVGKTTTLSRILLLITGENNMSTISEIIESLSQDDQYQLYDDVVNYDESGITGDTLLRKIAEATSPSENILMWMHLITLETYKHYAKLYMRTTLM